MSMDKKIDIGVDIETQKAEQEAAWKQWAIFIDETIAMLSENKKDYWVERLTRARTIPTKLSLCQLIRDRYELEWRKNHPIQGDISEDVPVKKASKKDPQRRRLYECNGF